MKINVFSKIIIYSLLIVMTINQKAFGQDREVIRRSMKGNFIRCDQSQHLIGPKEVFRVESILHLWLVNYKVIDDKILSIEQLSILEHEVIVQ
jgi:hypothetical protein